MQSLKCQTLGSKSALLSWTPPKNVVKDALLYRVSHAYKGWSLDHPFTIYFEKSPVKLLLNRYSETMVEIWAMIKDVGIVGTKKNVTCSTYFEVVETKPEFDVTIMHSAPEKILDNSTIEGKANVLIKWKPNFESGNPPGTSFDVEYKKVDAESDQEGYLIKPSENRDPDHITYELNFEVIIPNLIIGSQYAIRIRTYDDDLETNTYSDVKYINITHRPTKPRFETAHNEAIIMNTILSQGPRTMNYLNNKHI